MIETDESKWTDLFFEIITCVCVCVSLSSSSSSAMLFSVRTFYCFFLVTHFNSNCSSKMVFKRVYYRWYIFLYLPYLCRISRIIMCMKWSDLKLRIIFLFSHIVKKQQQKKKQHKGDVKCNDNENTRQYKNVIGEYGRAVCVWMQFICCYTEEGTKKKCRNIQSWPVRPVFFSSLLHCLCCAAIFV